jgi:circadian clock protein KaiC
MKIQTPIVDRCSTGTKGLDYILEGGLPRNYVYLIQGDPGVGKTTLALQFLLAGSRIGEKGLYVTLSETRKELLAVASSHGWSLDSLAIVDLSFIKNQLQGDNSLFHSADVERNEVIKTLMTEMDKMKPVRVVFDSLSEMRLLSGSPLCYRHQMLRFKDIFTDRGATVLLLVVVLEKTASDFGAEHRRLKISKLRGSHFRAGYHNYSIEPGGLSVFPRLIAADHHKQCKYEIVSSGIPELDAILGGGLHRGTSNLLSGPAGTGKSTFALQYASQAAGRGEKSKIYCFEENTRSILQRANAMGLTIEPHAKSGIIEIRQVDPGELSPGEFAHKVREAVLEGDVRIIIIDSLNGYLSAMPDERFLMIQLHELLTFLAQQGVVTILTLAQQGVIGIQGGPIELSYLADTSILLRYFEAAGRVKKAISVVKKRTGPHEDTIREYTFESSGIRFGQPLTDFQGVLTGTPTFVGHVEKILKRQKLRTSRRSLATTSSGSRPTNGHKN